MVTKLQIENRNKLLLRVADHIGEEPFRMNMEIWENSTRNKETTYQLKPPCGTAACIFGWVNLLGRKNPVRPCGSSVFKKGVAKLLHLNLGEADSLCNVSGWPNYYRRQYNRAKSVKERTRITILRIKAFAKPTGKV